MALHLSLLGLSACLVASLSLSFSPVTGQPLQWTRIGAVAGPQGEPAPREGHALGYHNGTNQLVVFGGGIAGPGLSGETWLLNLAGSPPTWKLVNVTGRDSPTPRKYFYSGVIESQNIFVISLGIGSKMAEFGDTWVFDFGTETWTEITPAGAGISIRYGGHFGVHYSGTSSTFWIGSGLTLATPVSASRYIDLYQLQFSGPATATWSTLWDNPSSGNQFNPLTPHGRCLQASAVVDENTMVMYGGCMRGGNGGGTCPANDGWFFDRQTLKWTALPSCPTPRVWSVMAPLTNRPGVAILFGGSEKYTAQLISVVQYPEDELFLMDTRTQTWTRLHATTNNTTYPGRRFRHAMVPADNGVVYLFGGQSPDSASTRYNDVWMLSGNPDLSDPFATQCETVWFSYAHLHGLLMALAWGLLIPSGFLIARYYKKVPYKGSSKVWFILHITCQILGVLLTVTAFVMIFPATNPIPTHPHAIIGILLTAIAIQQPINGIFRPHVKESKKRSKRRICWEYYHRIMGVLGILIGFVQVSLGVLLIVPPQGVWVAWFCLLVVWVMVFVGHEAVKQSLRFCKKKDSVGDEEHEMKSKF